MRAAINVCRLNVRDLLGCLASERGQCRTCEFSHGIRIQEYAVGRRGEVGR